MFNQLADRLYPAKSSFYDWTMPATASITPDERPPVTGDWRYFLNLAPSTCRLFSAKDRRRGWTGIKPIASEGGYLVTGVVGDGRSAATGFVKHNRRLDTEKPCRLFCEVESQKSRSTCKSLGNLANLHRDLNEITTTSKRKSFKNSFKYYFLILF